MKWASVPLLLVLATSAPADERTVGTVVKTIRFHPHGEPARIGLAVLGDRGAPGWKALASLVNEYRRRHPAVARAAADELVAGAESERLAEASQLYKRIDDEPLRATLVLGLAYRYADHEPLLWRHLRENRRGADALLRILAPRILPDDRLHELLAIPELAPIAYDALRARKLRVFAKELVPWARVIARESLDPVHCDNWLMRRDWLIFDAVALVLADRDIDVREGARCLLMSLSGKALDDDPRVWKGWLETHRDKGLNVDMQSAGRIEAAVVRGARWLRHDLAADGKALWDADTNQHWRVGSTGLAVMGLLAAGYPKDHPAIEKAVQTTLTTEGSELPKLPASGYETYNLAVLAMTLAKLDPKRFRVPLEALHRRLVVGMHPSGQWGYRCLRPTDTAKRGRGDYSITQYAALALRALSRAGFPVRRETWLAIAKGAQATQHKGGGWHYPGHGGRQVSMVTAGITARAIALEGLYGRDAAARIQNDPVLERARVYLGRLLVPPRYGREELYAYYGVERACALTYTAGFGLWSGVFDWHREGAKRLIEKQNRAGHWGWYERRVLVGHTFGRAIDTAYGILFLRRATATIGAGERVVVKTGLTEKEAPLPIGHDRPLEPIPPPPPAPPVIELRRARVTTRDGAAVLRGRVLPVDATLTIDGKPTPLDPRGGFRVEVHASGPKRYALVATDELGLKRAAAIEVVYDTVGAELRLLGAPQRHVGKQVLIFRASEPLRSLQVAGRVYPADGPIVRAAVQVGPSKRTLSAVAVDRAGNETRHSFTIEATNRVLVLDGASAVGFDIPNKPAVFTAELWARADGAQDNRALFADTEGSGFGLFLNRRDHPAMHVIARTGRTYTAVDARRAPKVEAWNHYALTYDGQAARFYINGKLQGVAAGAPFVVSRHRLFVGAEPDRHNNPGYFFKGAIDEVRFSRGLRYLQDFRPSKNFMRDPDTVLLLHFDLDRTLDDSGSHHHGWPHGAPKLSEKQASDVFAHAQREMRGLMPPLAAVPITKDQAVAQNERAKVDSLPMHMLDVPVKVTSRNGVPQAGIEVRGLHTSFDLTAEPVVTDAQGHATLRLPRGPWQIDLVSHEPAAGRCVFTRVTGTVKGPRRITVVLDEERTIRFVNGKGAPRAVHGLTLAWPDHSFHRDVAAVDGKVVVVCANDTPMRVQARRRPAELDPGFVVRRDCGLGETVIDVDADEATVHTWRGKGTRKLQVRYVDADALPFSLAFTTKDTRTVRFVGLPETVLLLDVEWKGKRFGYYPLPLPLDGKPRTFHGTPPFKATVGHWPNGDHRYGANRYSVDLRVFLSTPNGLLLRYDPRGAFTVAWEQRLDGQLLASGSTKPPYLNGTPPMDMKRMGDLRYTLKVRGPGENRTVVVPGHGQTAQIHVGKVHTTCFPEVAPNTRHWAACVDRGIRAYEETCPTRRPVTHIVRSPRMPPGLGGMGGYGGANGWMWLPEGSVYGFYGTWYWTGLLSHELGHVHNYWHGNPVQRKIMEQAGRRAGRRLWSIRPGMERFPEGNRYRELLEAVTRGELSVVQKIDERRGIPVLPKFDVPDNQGDGVLAPNIDITGDDAVFRWYYGAVFGEKAEARHRANVWAWSWCLTLNGFRDDEIQIAMFSYAAGTPLAWLARLRGTMVHDYRIDAAMKTLAEAEKNKTLADTRTRNHMSGIWRGHVVTPADDLAAFRVRIRKEVGNRWHRFLALKKVARAHFTRREMALGEELVLDALAEARLGGDGMLDRALAEIALLWIAR